MDIYWTCNGLQTSRISGTVDMMARGPSFGAGNLYCITNVFDLVAICSRRKIKNSLNMYHYERT